MKRTRFHIIHELLGIVKKINDEPSYRGATKWDLQYLAKMGGSFANTYIRELANRGLITGEAKGDRLTWWITPKGRELHDKLGAFLREFGLAQ